MYRSHIATFIHTLLLLFLPAMVVSSMPVPEAACFRRLTNVTATDLCTNAFSRFSTVTRDAPEPEVRGDASAAMPELRFLCPLVQEDTQKKSAELEAFVISLIASAPALEVCMHCIVQLLFVVRCCILRHVRHFRFRFSARNMLLQPLCPPCCSV
jgi:hypothetical protein